VRQFPSQRQQILEDLVALNSRLRPQVVFLPSPTDTHQDHSVIAAEGFRAFKRCSMLGYEVPWNNLDFRTSCFVEISEEDLRTKIDALSMYRSQAHRAYASEEFIRSLATVRGVQIGKRYAESFEVIRWVL
jgi:LmbE family N-acetylglucosaminyl deacetylase